MVGMFIHAYGLLIYKVKLTRPTRLSKSWLVNINGQVDTCMCVRVFVYVLAASMWVLS